MSGFMLIVTKDQLERAGVEYVANGPVATRALRQDEVDGAMVFLQCEALAKHRKPVEPHPAVPHHTVLSHQQE